KGALADFPFHTTKPGEQPKGVFQLAGEFEGLKLNYTPGHVGRDGKEPEWPLLEEGRGASASIARGWRSRLTAPVPWARGWDR
ncbi:hypothetical protein ACP3WZ_25030, partial [Salmonella enterica]|uniref:hypothetical protein n=1 Tax=Salmonella enterica TaxID=28901 RepID=UPI003CF8CAA2